MIPKSSLNNYQFNLRIVDLIADIMCMMHSLYFKSNDTLEVKTETSEDGISGVILLNDCADPRSKDCLVRNQYITEVQQKLQIKYPEATFQLNRLRKIPV